MLRVLFVAPRFPPDVVSAWSMAFARLVAKIQAHLPTTLVAGYHRDRRAIPEDALGVNLQGVGRVGRWIRLWRATHEVLARRPADVVIVGGLGMPPLREPVLAIARDLRGEGWGSIRMGLLARMVLKVPRALVVPTGPVREQLSALGAPRWRVRRLPIGQEVPPEPAPLPADQGVLRLVHPGTIHPARGPHISLDAVSRLPPRDKARVHLTIAGPVADPRYLAQLRVAATGQPVTLAPGVADVGPQIRAAHLVVYPKAVEEGFPDAAVRAMALGRPVVWPDLPALREVLDGQGLRIPTPRVEHVRSAIQRVLADRVDLAEIGARGHAHAQERYAWSVLWPQWHAVLAQVAGPTAG